MKVFETISEYRHWRAEQSEIAFVPTMGNLHQGHLSLVKKAQQYADTVVVSIFVNPLQFAAHEDLSAYPRTLEQDLKTLDKANVSAVFLPQIQEIYPSGVETQTQVIVPDVSKGLCGDSRPHFFQGVATVVCKLFNITKPDFVIFGEKDYQQYLVIKKMVKDLNMPITIISSPIIRKESGLAMSSRNQYLSEAGRQKAAKIYRYLQEASQNLQDGQDIAMVIAKTKQNLKNDGFEIDYLELREEETLGSLSQSQEKARLFIAVKLENTRLIDNLPLSFPGKNL